MRIADALLPEFDQEAANTRKVLERVPTDKFGYRPHPKSFELGKLAQHVATIYSWGADVLTSESFDVAPVNGPAYRPPVARDSGELVAMFDRFRDDLRTALKATENEAFGKQWSLLSGGKPIFTMSRIAVLRGMVFNHLIHHRAQITVYLRLLEIAVPGLYGPSADEG
jgi:uncharacterized damage-inducible protein DinB